MKFTSAFTCRLLLALVSLATSQVARAQDAAAEKITYDEHVKPIFREHCFSCHNQDTKKSDLSLAAYGATMAGGASGAVIEPGDERLAASLARPGGEQCRLQRCR